MESQKILSINQISGIRNNNDNKLLARSPYLLQLKNFEDRIKNKVSKSKHSSMVLRKPQNVLDQKQVLKFVKEMTQQNYNAKKFFEIDNKQNLWKQIDIERKIQNNFLIKVRQKIYSRKIKSRNNDNNAISSSVFDSIPTQQKSRISSQSIPLTRQMKLRRFTNDVSFLKYKKNKNIYVARLQ